VHCSELQWRFFNQALEEQFIAGNLVSSDGAKVEGKKAQNFWDVKTYKESLVQTGGKIRLAEFFAERGIKAANGDDNALILEIYARKSELFVDFINDNAGTSAFSLRPGVLDLLRTAKASGIKTAFITVTNRLVMEAFMKGFKLEGLIDFATSDEDLPKFNSRGKPSPDVYWWAVKEILGEDAVQEVLREDDARIVSKKIVKNCIAIEDTWISLQSPVNAGIPCIAIPSEWSVTQDFSQATVKVNELTEFARVGESESVLQRVRQLTDFTRGAQNATILAC